jgi:Tfp pilus assembly protein PilV
MVRRHIRRQRGSALIIALIAIVLISLAVVSAFNLSSSNLKAVTNVQYRSEAVTVANAAIETVVSGSFLAALNSDSAKDIDLDKDGTADYRATVSIPKCPLRVKQVTTESPTGYEVDPSTTLSGTYIADYELKSKVEDAVTNAKVTVRQGVRVPLSETDYQSYVKTACPSTNSDGVTLVTS